MQMVDVDWEVRFRRCQKNAECSKDTCGRADRARNGFPPHTNQFVKHVPGGGEGLNNGIKMNE